MKIVDFGEVNPPAWNVVCDQSDLAWLFHRRQWVEIETRFFVRANHSFALAAQTGIVGVCPLFISDPKSGSGWERVLHTGIHRHTGLALLPSLDAHGASAARTACMQHIFSLAEQHDVDRIQLNSHNLAPQNLGPERREIPFWVEEYGAELGLAFTSYGMSPAPGMASCNSDQIVSLELDEQALFMQLEEACRRAVRKADSSGLSFREATHVDCIADYYRIAQLSARRTGEHLPPESYYSDIWNKFADDGRCAVFLVEYESKTVAALFLLVDKAACSYLGGVSDPDYLPLRVNDFAHWRAMLWAKKRGLRHYRLGPWFPSVSEEWAIAKVSRFKKRFGGRSMTIIQGSIFRHPERYLDQAKVLLEELCRKR